MTQFDQWAMYTGYAVFGFGAAIVLGTLIYTGACISNRAQKKALESYGGWKVFREYVRWYKDNKMGSDAP